MKYAIDFVLYKKINVFPSKGGAVPVGPVIMIGLSPFPGVKEFVYSNSAYKFPFVRKCVQWLSCLEVKY